MRVALGSVSESKLRATRAAFARAFPGAEIIAVPVPSAVAPQPVGDEEAIAGARHRAQESRRLTGADLGVGIEGAVHRDPRGTWITAWVAVVDGHGREGLACGLRIRLPGWIAGRALAGEPVGEVVDALLGSPEAHEALGIVGVLTGGLVNRQAALEQAIIAALAPFLAKDLYEREDGDEREDGAGPVRSDAS